MQKMIINSDIVVGKISKNIFGHFAEHLGRCIYEGIWVGRDSKIPNTNGIRNDVIEALRKLQVPVLRWPGGCFADEYHWKDGVGPYEKRPQMINTHWGGVVENNHFGTHEFLEFCELIGAEPFISGNVGSGTVREMQEWIEYLTFDGESPMANWRRKNGRKEPWKIPFFGIGNENWGCGGNMRPEFYADQFLRYNTYVRNLSGNRIYRIACGPSDHNYRWTEVLMKQAGYAMDGLSLHYYTIPGPHWGDKGSATDFGEAEWFTTMRKTMYMEELITRHSTIMDVYDPKKRVGLIIDEWGIWSNVEPGTNPGFLYQQNTLRDALVAGINLNIFNNHCQRVKMANIAQMVNVLQAVIHTNGEQMMLTPTYHVFEMYKVHQNAELVHLHLETTEYKHGNESIPQISVSASKNEAGDLHISICNLNPNESAKLCCDLRGGEYVRVQGKVLTAETINAHNTFEEPERVIPQEFSNARIEEEKLFANIPAKSVVVLKLKAK